MIFLDSSTRDVPWEEAGIILTMVPVYSDQDQQFAQQSTAWEDYDEKGKPLDAPRRKFDSTLYAQLLGKAAIKDWTDVVDDKGEPVPCTEKNIEQFMRIEPAQNFVIQQIKSVNLHIANGMKIAKND